MEMKRYVCDICGHKYSPENGEPLQNLSPGIAFEALPADWTCPVCFAEKDHFIPE